mgnify:FL=1
MPLPQIATPTYELVLPSTGKRIRYRPFLVKEEKILILALESEDQKQITEAVKSTLKSCISTRGIKIDELPTFDIEYIFLNIRGKSVGESVDLIVTCPDDETTTVPVKIYIDEIKVEQNKNHTRDINLDGIYTLRMKYPSLNQFIETNFAIASDQKVTVDDSFKVIASCIDMVFSAEESWSASDCTEKELNDWLGTLDSKQFKQIEDFFETMPKLSHTIKVTNPNTKVESDVKLEGITSFFE